MVVESVSVDLSTTNRYGPEPQMIKCSACGQEGLTKTEPADGVLTWLIFGILCFFMCWCGCCLIPFYSRRCRNIEHYCTNCNAFVGVYKRL